MFIILFKYSNFICVYYFFFCSLSCLSNILDFFFYICIYSDFYLYSVEDNVNVNLVKYYSNGNFTLRAQLVLFLGTSTQLYLVCINPYPANVDNMACSYQC
jgi:hypothetical protein